MNYNKEVLQKMVENGITMKEIGKLHQVSRQRIYQVLTKLGIETVIRKKKNYLRDKSEAHYWLNRILTTKRLAKAERLWLLENLDLPTYCPILGIKLRYEGTGEQGFSRGEDAPSIDRINPLLPYSKNNIVVISWRANRIKNDGTPEEHRRIYEFYKDLT